MKMGLVVVKDLFSKWAPGSIVKTGCQNGPTHCPCGTLPAKMFGWIHPTPDTAVGHLNSEGNLKAWNVLAVAASPASPAR